MDYKKYIGTIIPIELAARIWKQLECIVCYKSLTYVEDGCIIDVA